MAVDFDLLRGSVVKEFANTTFLNGASFISSTQFARKRKVHKKSDKLAAGKYDWAHVAMQLWPERVVSKCATDRSLAIAHGLEAVFWEEFEKSYPRTKNDVFAAFVERGVKLLHPHGLL